MINNKKSFFLNFFSNNKNKKKNISKNNFFSKLSSKWKNITKKFSSNIKNFFLSNKIDKYFIKKLKEQLILSDFGIKLTNKIIKKINFEINSKGINNNEIVYSILKNKLKKILLSVSPYKNKKNYFPYIILVIGVNGVGKTSSIGKLAFKYIISGKSVMLAAGDTYRISAIDQLKKWGKINSISVISQKQGSDSASVVYDAIQSAKSKKIDILIIDTAGRFNSNLFLIKELKKIIRVIKKIDNYAPHEILLTLDSTIGQNSIFQTKIFHKLFNINGIILTKLDSTAKGGFIFSIIKKFSIPISYISIGENKKDLYVFNSEEYINNFFKKIK